ncbi:MAG: DUF4340 domain-containing protein [Kofleriaceae bacterium]|nr:DUF4340 domain-containing protein [Kofleriaceae bacterium]
MLTRFHKFALGLLAVQLVLAVVMLRTPDDAAAAKDKPLLPGFDVAKVTRVVVSSSQSTAPIDLVKRDGGWVLASHFDYPVDATKITDLLGPLAKMAAAAPIATSPNRHKQLRVANDDHERRLIVTIDGKEQTILLGGSAGARRTAVRLGNEERVFAVRGISAYSAGTEPRQWIDASYVKVPRDEISAITVQRGASTVELARASTSAPWTASLDGAPVAPAAGESLDATAIDNLVTAASTIELAAPGDPKRDVATPTATITIARTSTTATSPAPVVIDVLLDGDRYWVRQRGADRAGLVDKHRLEPLLGVTRDKLVQSRPQTPPKG